MIYHDVSLVGDGIENPWNAQTMLHAAEMFAARCLFRDPGPLSRDWAQTLGRTDSPPLATPEQLRGDFKPIVAFDNIKGARDVFDFRLPPGSRTAVVVGNERAGISRELRDMADACVQLPMLSRSINCLNVAAASAVALYYMRRGDGGGMLLRPHPQKHRPEVLLLGPKEHVELGSTIRSAAALGWGRVLVEDLYRAWFGCDRGTRSEGRGAARRGRNPIHVIPAVPRRRYAFDAACIVVKGQGEVPLHRAGLSRGPRQLIVLPDESAVDISAEDWGRLAKEVTVVGLDLPRQDSPYHYRLTSSIALAEVARQVGRPSKPAGRAPPFEPSYESVLELTLEQAGEKVYLEELLAY